MTDFITLRDRAIIEITGEDRKKFLQGLITNDIFKASDQNLIYSAMLSAQGRFLYDFFICEIGEKLILDCFATRRDEIMQKFDFYKLRSKVTIAKNDALIVTHNFGKIGFPDPRNEKLGHRFYQPKSEIKNSPETIYHFARISRKIPESENDLTYDKSFILEFGFDNLNAIDYQKGCYIGQELTARTHYRGEIRKKIFHIKIDGTIAAKNSEITCEGKSAGIILSSVFHESELHALALIKISDDQNSTMNFKISEQKISVIS